MLNSCFSLFGSRLSSFDFVTGFSCSLEQTLLAGSRRREYLYLDFGRRVTSNLTHSIAAVGYKKGRQSGRPL